MHFANKMRTLLVIALLSLSLAQATEVRQATEATTTTGKPQQVELPEHIQTLITNHIHHVLQNVKNKPDKPHTLTGTVEAASKGSVSQVVEPFSGLLPPLAHSSDVHIPAPDQPTASPALQPTLQSLQANDPQVRVINHEATGSLLHQGRPVAQNKVVMPPVPYVVLSLPGQQPVDVADKVNKLQQHVSQVMKQAQLHIPLAIQEAIKIKKEQQNQQNQQNQHKQQAQNTDAVKDQNEEEQKSQQQDKGKYQDNENKTTPQQDSSSTPLPTKSKTGRSLDKWHHHANQVHIPQLIAENKEEIELGKCSFQCPRQALSICASNGKCVVNFPGQCELSQWNCFNTKNVFHQVHDSECQNTIKCYKRDMM